MVTKVKTSVNDTVTHNKTATLTRLQLNNLKQELSKIQEHRHQLAELINKYQMADAEYA
eukprot:CAMPEP_0176364210 /NCGR_PEP_ID=MMETSP0126-20121128/19630_1 /TAXON_ID=141414 ORGANISM="Strombidinopsis acuminatum, Strain SPMC142" /NCGR_SAMPLE_ID=MMETSP0126 /ASSEMBLY_ACC=CAM_ASM_000229 /LENGTH=58 /DNA_ID=CAMNT_0017720759 /DNA_START=923 /DNA_END=1099 /DNA_ORIENTATION=+